MSSIKYMSATRFAIQQRIPVKESKEKFRKFFLELVQYIDANGLYEFEGIRDKCKATAYKINKGDFSKGTIDRIAELFKFCSTWQAKRAREMEFLLKKLKDREYSQSKVESEDGVVPEETE